MGKGCKYFKKNNGGFNLFLLLISCFLLLTFMYGCAPQETVKQEASIEGTQKRLPEVTSVEASDHRLTISADAPFEYTIYKPSDPFKVVVELKGVTPGKYTGKIEPGDSGITEIRAYHVKAPTEGTKIEMLLSTPADVVPEYTNGMLTLSIKETFDDAMESVGPGEGLTEEPAVVSEEVVEEGASESPELPPAQYVEALSMERRKDRVVVVIKGDGKMIPDIYPLENRLVIDIPGADMRASVPETVIKPLRGIRWGEHEDRLRVVLDLDPNTSFDVVSIDDRIEVSLQTPGLVEEGLVAETEELPSSEVQGTKGLREEVPRVPAEGITEGKYTGKKISFDFQDADIIPIFRLLADVSGYNIVVDPKVRGKITMKLINVPWDQALDLILKTHNLDKVVEGNIIRIAPVAALAKEREEIAKKKAAERKAEPLVTQVFPISYADVKDVKAALDQAKILSERGNISVDKRISSLIVKDVPSNIPKVEELVKTLDKPTPQVMIEARIVEVNTKAQRELGIRWGITARTYDSLVGLGGLGLGLGGLTTPYMIDFPSAAGPGEGSGITFGFLNPARTVSLDLEISALASTGRGKIISNPRIVTVDNEEAFISQGKSIPVRKLTSEGTVATDFKDVKLELKVSPHITPDGSVILNVEVKKEELDYTIPSVEGVPGTDKKEARTNVIIKGGETLVIGGIYKTIKNNSEKGVPGAKDIPILGWLFKSEKKESETNELLIFITPRIIERSVVE